MKMLFNSLSTKTKIGLVAAGAIFLGTALNVAWSAAIFPHKEDTAAYTQEIRTETLGGLLGFSLAVGGGLLAGGAIRPK